MDVPTKRAYLWLWGILSLYAAAFLAYSLTYAFTWDESYHLLAAQLMSRGRTPYIDFCFPQTPLNAYWNSWLMRAFGEGWRVPHASAALFTIGAVALTADFVFRRFPAAEWRLPAALTAGLATGLNAMLFQYGPVAQPYGICLFSMLVAFRLGLRAVARPGWAAAALSGVFAGAAAASSLLTASAAPVLLAWMFFCNRAGSRRTKAAAFCAGVLLPFAPVVRLFILGPQQTWFNVFRYHVYFRKLYWSETTQHDAEVLTSWVDSGQAMTLGLLAVAGLIYLARSTSPSAAWPAALKREFYLAGWLAVGLGLLIGRAHPTFPRYFLLIVPFVAIPAVVGLHEISVRLRGTNKPLGTVLFVLALLGLDFSRSMYERREFNTWATYQRLADKVNSVTPPGAPVIAEEPIYFLTRRTPPPGFELAYTHALTLTPAEGALFHILTTAQVKQQVQAGRFATAYSCSDDDIATYGFKTLYGQHADLEDCSVFWNGKK